MENKMETTISYLGVLVPSQKESFFAEQDTARP